MHLLADENLPFASVRHLRRAGHDVLSIAESHRGVSDADVLKLAIEDKRVVLTFDVAFAGQVYRESGSVPAGLVLFRFDPEFPEEPAVLLDTAVSGMQLDLTGWFTVITRDRIRQRPLRRPPVTS